MRSSRRHVVSVAASRRDRRSRATSRISSPSRVQRRRREVVARRGVADSRIGLRTVGTSPASTTGSRPEPLGQLDAAAHVVDRPARHAGRGEHVEPLLRPMRVGQPRRAASAAAARGCRCAPRRVAKRASSAQLRRAERRAELAELAVVAGDDDQVAVAGRQRLVREQAQVRVAHPLRHDAARDVRRGLVDHAPTARSRAGWSRRAGPRR